MFFQQRLPQPAVASRFPYLFNLRQMPIFYILRIRHLYILYIIKIHSSRDKLKILTLFDIFRIAGYFFTIRLFS